MNRVAQILIVVLALLASACSTSRKTVATNAEAEAQLTATTEQQHHAGSIEKAAVITNVTTDERRNVVIDFATVEFYPGGVPSVPSDSTAAPDWLNMIIAAAASEEGQKAKPPNVKSVTKGRATLNGEKNEQTRTETQTEKKTTEDSAIKQDVEANNKEATQTKTAEKPKFTFWDWLYLAVVGAFIIGAVIFVVRVVAKLRHQFRNRKT